MTIAYPASLPLALSASKSRSQAASFTATDPGAGKLYVQPSGQDTPVVWSMQFRFTPAEAAQFVAWCVTDAQRGLLPFTLPIKTEFGLIEHTCRFLPDGLLDCSEEGQSWLYSAKVVARAQVIPQGALDMADFIIALENWSAWAEVLDIAFSRTLA